MQKEILRNPDDAKRLRAALSAQYGITAAEITPAARGYYGETWKIHTTAGTYFLKMDALPFHQKRFQSGLSVVEYLCKNGVDFVGNIVKTRDGKLFSTFDTALMGLFEWVDGENLETDGTKASEYRMLCNIYPLTKPGLGIPAVSFSDEAAARFYRQWELLKKAPQTAANAAVLELFARYRAELSHSAQRLSKLARRCRADVGDFYLTHGDAGGNFFVGKGRNYLFDWDEAMYAPLERDAWVMGCYEWARNLFDQTLKKNNIPYRLRPERLAFYCYHMYFFYLGEFLLVHPICDQSARMLDYFENGWIRSRIAFADTIL